MNKPKDNMPVFSIIITIATICTGLVAGLMYSYQCSVNPGLGMLPDKEYIMAMQAINRAILNPLFFTSFMGSLILLPASAWMSYERMSSPTFMLLLGATVVYVVGVFGVTMFGNVPLNETLDKFSVNGASATDFTRARMAFSVAWNKLHAVRTAFSFIAFVLAVVTLVVHNSRGIR